MNTHQFDEKEYQYAIAVIGMAGEFSNSPSLEHLWRNLENGYEAVRPLDKQTLEKNGCPQFLQNHPQFMPVSAMLEDVQRFDAEFFGFTPAEACLMDPQLRMMLQVSWHAFENANYAPGSGGLTGVFAGAHKSDYLLCNAGPEYSIMTGMKAMSASLFNGQDFLSTWLSYKLGLTGPSLNIQTACSTGLVTVATACMNLLDYSCDMALAVTGAILCPRDWGYLAETGSILSSDGHCRPFDAQATGTITGEGVGAVILKRLPDALRDNDTVHGIIRGYAINNDGAARAGYTTPGVPGQIALLEQALASSGLNASDVSYVEAHGTGTHLGDPVEFKALQRVYGKGHRAAPCQLGSIKANLGHLGACAGMVGLIKVLLMLKHGAIPPQINYSQPNPEISLEDSPFTISTQKRHWQDIVPRVAGISSFGLGGTNCHMLVQGADHLKKLEQSKQSRVSFPLCLSAKSQAALDRLRESWIDFLEDMPESGIHQAALSALAGRPPMSWRMAVNASRPDEAAAVLRNAPETACIPTSQGRTVLLLPDHMDMNRALPELFANAFPDFAEIFSRCIRLEKKMCGPDLSPASQDKSLPQKALTKRLAVATAFALGHVLASAGIRPDMFLGHGTGELAASALAGKSSLEEVLALVDTPEAHPSYAGSKQCGTDSQECCSPWGRHSTLVEAADSTLQQKITLCRDRGATIFMTLWPSQTDKDIRNVFENSNIPFSWIYLLPSPDVLSQLTPVQIRAAFAEGIGKLFKNGCNITPDRNTPLMQIPSYPFARDIHWISNGRSVSDALRTPKGKTCSLPPNAMVPNHAPQAAESSVEEGLQTIWNEALGISDIELDDDFFMRGGTSLSAISIIAALEQHTGLSIPLPEFLDLRTIRRVLDHLALLAEKAEVTAGVH